MFQILAPNVLTALQLGSVCALITLGYTMVHGILTMINFAHGDIFMVSSYLALAGAAFLLGLRLHHRAGPPAEIQPHPAVLEAYLGRDHLGAEAEADAAALA